MSDLQHTGCYLLDVGHVDAQFAQALHVHGNALPAPLVGHDDDAIEYRAREHNGQNEIWPYVELEGTHYSQGLVEATRRVRGKGARVGERKE